VDTRVADEVDDVNQIQHDVPQHILMEDDVRSRDFGQRSKQRLVRTKHEKRVNGGGRVQRGGDERRVVEEDDAACGGVRFEVMRTGLSLCFFLQISWCWCEGIK
jgi:hypothetical protein